MEGDTLSFFIGNSCCHMIEKVRARQTIPINISQALSFKNCLTHFSSDVPVFLALLVLPKGMLLAVCLPWEHMGKHFREHFSKKT